MDMLYPMNRPEAPPLPQRISHRHIEVFRAVMATGSATGAFLFLGAMALLGAVLTLGITRERPAGRGAP